MFLNGTRGYNRSGEQVAHGKFLILFSKVPGSEVRCLVRHARMVQSGQFMVAFVKAGPHEIYLSGTYGNDGLTRDPKPGLWEALEGHSLPLELQEKFWKGDGWNSAGSEGPDIYAYGNSNIEMLSGLKKVDWDYYDRLNKWEHASKEFKKVKYYHPNTIKAFVNGSKESEASMFGLLMLRIIMQVIGACI